MKELNQNRLLELLADQTLFDLTQEEKAELEQLENHFPNIAKDFSFELTTAAINLSALGAAEEMPVNLRKQIIANADEYFASDPTASNNENFVPAIGRSNDSAVFDNARQVTESDAPRPFWQWLGWAFAAAACLALAVNLWMTRGKSQPEIVQNPPVVQTPTPAIAPEQERTQMLAVASDAVKISLANPKNAKDVLGEMVWSNTLQKGYIRFTNLPENDVNKETYQLWIVDEGQNPKTPVDGGVFDITKNGETIVTVDPKLKIKKPLAIAVTVEKPGGVVVSAQEKVVALAKI